MTLGLRAMRFGVHSQTKRHLQQVLGIKQKPTMWQIWIEDTDIKPNGSLYTTTNAIRATAVIFKKKEYPQISKFRRMHLGRVEGIQRISKKKMIATVLRWKELHETILIARFMGPTWGPSRAYRTQVGPCWPNELCHLGSLHENIMKPLVLVSLKEYGWFTKSAREPRSLFP